ncbi:MAG: Rpn family recombination-promoting nuclease/putative transposase [Candidatus Symbiothrix sp.]|jgi:predicted transposase/invertase (TIGR01784 family)|nr:Rpn family recombination-promoting nuclease/putative transposase [Candidatus Symbiothrix sp.]
MAKDNIIRFDWAAKRLLRQKSNFVILEGFLSTLFGEPIRINRMLESEGNKEDAADKFNRVDMLAENSRGELIIIEVQNNRELDYFHRMMYGVSKVMTEYISQGEPYSHIKKVYSVSIVYFDMGQGTDYVYHGRTEFRGIHTDDVLRLTSVQQKQFMYQNVGELFPEYYILRLDEFDKKAVTPLDEWISFLKTGNIPNTARASGLREARERLNRDKLSKNEQRAYDSHMEALRYQRSVIQTGLIEGREEGREEGRAEGKAEGKAEGLAEGLAQGKAEGLAEGSKKQAITVAKRALAIGMSPEDIMHLTGLTEKEIENMKK